MLVIGNADLCDQKNALRWEHIYPPWVLPDYVTELAQALQVMKAWIATGGVSNSETMVTDVPAPTNNMDEGKYKAPGSEGVPQDELPTPHQLVPKVLQLDQVEHTLDKGAWETMPATCQGWKIFVTVSDRYLYSSPHSSSVFRAS